MNPNDKTDGCGNRTQILCSPLGRQTLITTKTGLWRVTYNGENRPIRWEQIEQSNNPNNRTILQMSYDHMGRRREKNAQHFFYDVYLQVADNGGNAYTWDCTEPVATRPLAWQHQAPGALHQVPIFYTHDGNKNVSEVVAHNGSLAAHYEYAPFGAVVFSQGASAADNSWRFSSEYTDDELGCDYYNYRHHEPIAGRWLQRDECQDDDTCHLLYLFVENDAVAKSDGLGNKNNPSRRMPGIPPPRPPIDPYVPIPDGPAVRSDGSIADAWASALAMTYRSEAFAILSGISMCAYKYPHASASLPPENGTAIGSCNCKCCVVSYLAYVIGDNDLFYLESAAVLDMPCDDAKSAPGLWAVYPNFVRRFFYKNWR